MTKEQFDKILAEHVNLSSNGIDAHLHYPNASNSLSAEFHYAQLACEWLADKLPGKKSQWVNSYGLKHVMQREISARSTAGKDGYTSNGSFIVAAIHLGFEIEYPKGDLNVNILIDKQKLREAQEAGYLPADVRYRQFL